jgi:hypothetical protein
MSQFQRCAWPGLSGNDPEPRSAGGQTAEQKEKLRAWWAEMWVDTEDICPECSFRKDNGEDGFCFYYEADERTIKVFM